MAQAACSKAPTVEVEGRTRAERTLNMDSMFTTLDVLKFSGWLNADAACRVEGKAWEEGTAWRAGEGGAHRGNGGGASSVQGGYQLRRVVRRAGHARSAP